MTKETYYEIGVDEAGRGAVIGPLVITSVAIDNRLKEDLIDIVKKDSKKYSPKTREKLYNMLMSKLNYINIFKISPEEINRYMFNGINLNKLELEFFSKSILNLLKIIEGDYVIPIYVDSMTYREVDCKYYISNYLHEHGIPRSRYKVVCEHKADEKYLPVKIASIISKVVRDHAIRKLKSSYGDLGSGYPSDSRTIAFLKERLTKLDDEEKSRLIRLKWKTIENIFRDVE